LASVSFLTHVTPLHYITLYSADDIARQETWWRKH